MPVRYVVKTGCQWRMLPHDFPDWTVVYQQARRWMQAGVFEADRLMTLRVMFAGAGTGSATVGSYSWTVARCNRRRKAATVLGYDGAKKKNGSKVHIAVDTLGNLLALKVTAANEQERARWRNWRPKYKR